MTVVRLSTSGADTSGRSVGTLPPLAALILNWAFLRNRRTYDIAVIMSDFCDTEACGYMDSIVEILSDWTVSLLWWHCNE